MTSAYFFTVTLRFLSLIMYTCFIHIAIGFGSSGICSCFLFKLKVVFCICVILLLFLLVLIFIFYQSLCRHGFCKRSSFSVLLENIKYYSLKTFSELLNTYSIFLLFSLFKDFFCMQNRLIHLIFEILANIGIYVSFLIIFLYRIMKK